MWWWIHLGTMIICVCLSNRLFAFSLSLSRSFLLRIYCSEHTSNAQYTNDAQDLFFTSTDTIHSSLSFLPFFNARLHIIIYIQLRRCVCIYIYSNTMHIIVTKGIQTDFVHMIDKLYYLLIHLLMYVYRKKSFFYIAINSRLTD